MNIFQVYYDAGRTGLMISLAVLPIDKLKKLCRENCLDCSGSYRKYQDSRELAEFMVYRVKCMSERGYAFR
jgi:hypothetical protein